MTPLLLGLLLTAAPDASTAAPTWETRLVDATAGAWREQPELGAALRRLRGLEPAHYLKRRRPDPEVGRELKNHAELGWPFMVELLGDDGAYPFAPRAAYPARLSDAAWAELRTRERAALRIGLLGALGNSRAPLVLPVLVAVLVDPARPESERRVAALAAGELTRELGAAMPPELVAVADDPAASAWLRGGALVAVAKAGGAHPEAALTTLATRLGHGESEAFRQAAVTALAVLASQTRGRPNSAALLGRIGDLLVDELATERATPYEPALLEALSVVGAPAETSLRTQAANAELGALARARLGRALERVRAGVERSR